MFQYSINTSEDMGHVPFIFTVTKPKKMCLFIVVFSVEPLGENLFYQPMQAF